MEVILDKLLKDKYKDSGEAKDIKAHFLDARKKMVADKSKLTPDELKDESKIAKMEAKAKETTIIKAIGKE